jgi:hypothetical protein
MRLRLKGLNVKIIKIKLTVINFSFFITIHNALILVHSNISVSVPFITKVLSESRCVLIKGDGRDVHEHLYRPETV